MIAAQTADANPYRKIYWDTVNWAQVEETVRRLQTCIVKALKKNALRQVKNLQRLLTKSLSARLLAVKRLWNWVNRQHPQKGKRWRAKRYFHRGQKWVFTAKTKQGKVEEQHLASSTKIRRHILIKGKANPYDGEWSAYFEKKGTKEKRSMCCLEEPEWDTEIIEEPDSVTGVLQVLELNAGKLARSVLRGGSHGNVAFLPDPGALARSKCKFFKVFCYKCTQLIKIQ